MRYEAAVALIGLVVFSCSTAAEPPDPLAAKKEKWQKQLEDTKFHFSKDQAGVMYSLSQCIRGDYKIHMIYDPKTWWMMTFKFERDGKELLTIDGHDRSVFRIDGNVLYFAHFPPLSSGCTVTAHDLTTGKRLWETRLNAIGDIDHSKYRNEVTMDLVNLTGLDKEGEGSVCITGRESYGDYCEVLDRNTGKVLAHKTYRQGSGVTKQP
jgi:hypothetical protein